MLSSDMINLNESYAEKQNKNNYQRNKHKDKYDKETL